MVLRRDQPYARVVIPDHKQVRLGTLRRIITDAGLTVEQFIRLVGRECREGANRSWQISWPPENYAVLHHEAHALEKAYILERVAFHCNQIRLEAGFYRAQLFLAA